MECSGEHLFVVELSASAPLTPFPQLGEHAHGVPLHVPAGALTCRSRSSCAS
jgi:hypothetical protein